MKLVRFFAIVAVAIAPSPLRKIGQKRNYRKIFTLAFVIATALTLECNAATASLLSHSRSHMTTNIGTFSGQ